MGKHKLESKEGIALEERADRDKVLKQRRSCSGENDGETGLKIIEGKARPKNWSATLAGVWSTLLHLLWQMCGVGDSVNIEGKRLVCYVGRWVDSPCVAAITTVHLTHIAVTM